MNSKSKTILIYAFVFLAGGIPGIMIGGYGGINLGVSLILNNSLKRDALFIETQIDVMRSLRSSEVGTALELLESRLDDRLIIFDPIDPYPNLENNTVVKVNKAIVESKEYRREFPRVSKRPSIDRLVENRLNREFP
ncbi:MAG: hypothetical protein ACI845_001984 [Gammaproteobacteria bacterium]|jgi:hypothetical protein